MQIALDSVAIELPCPHCGKKNSKTIGRLKTKPDLTCSYCGQWFSIDKAELAREVAKVEQQIQQALAGLGRLGQ